MTSQKLADAYMPDRGTRKEKVIVGLSGGIDSYVAAYLLKIQKYDLIAVTVVPSWDEQPGESTEFLSCGLNEKTLEKTQAFAHQLGIPHFTVRLSSEFKEKIVERWMARKVMGRLPDQCWDCHQMRMEILHAKTREFGGKILATGHFAKVFRHEATGVSFVQSSNDERFDQSALLSRLPQEILSNLMLPLADLQKKEVVKLAENFGLDETPRAVAMFQCFPSSEKTANYLVTKIPERFRKDGAIVNEFDDPVGDHAGIIHHRAGEEWNPGSGREPRIIAGYSNADKKILLQPATWFQRDKMILRKCRVPPETAWSMPFRGVLMKDGVAHEGWFFPKTLSSCAVELDQPVSVFEGETLSVMKKKGKNARVLLTGNVSFIPEVPKVEGEGHVPVDYSRDF